MVKGYSKRPIAVGSLQWLGQDSAKILSDNELVWQSSKVHKGFTMDIYYRNILFKQSAVLQLHH